ncbi:MAG: glutamate--tRNA ligase [Rickettsiales bacterium]|nr:glutamate--tRNA ligase [Rickettsiales bacterium]
MLRFAPSPTGYLHAGNLRVAILNYFFAKKNNKEFFLRIDDTDQDRSKKKYVDSIIKDLDWLGIEYKNIVKQSERFLKYTDVFNFLKKKEFIYPCFETGEELSLKRKVQLKMGKPPIYDRSSLKLSKEKINELIKSGQKPHWRLKLDNEPIYWEDLIHGKISFNNLSVSDPVVFRSDEMPLFTITSVVDDIELKVSHILRGDDHITNTAAQIKLFKYLDANVPEFGHFPLIQSRSGSSLSKRDNSLSIREFKEKDIFPIVLINYLSKIGTSNSLENLDSVESLLDKFSYSNFSKSSVLFNFDEILRLNAKYIKTINYKSINNFSKKSFGENFWGIIKNNIDSVEEAEEWFEIIYEKIDFSEKIKIEKKLMNDLKDSLPKTIDINSWSLWTNEIKKTSNIKPKELFKLIRLILTGKNYGPSMDQLLSLFDREEVLRRIVSNCEQK